ncbi:hypothetical protein BV25DRAFT_1435793 [Artomyces pyxidatus]|uniref:Uncharacterized protein n=1 Tax=Artomyces pyxidatus TaxID=48021 RepID=A0ACB8SLN0_9AGAM|nr:hypothetical protein BV25DRAFT_1435793 [Artomyces pyxidatus]
MRSRPPRPPSGSDCPSVVILKLRSHVLHRMHHSYVEKRIATCRKLERGPTNSAPQLDQALQQNIPERRLRADALWKEASAIRRVLFRSARDHVRKGSRKALGSTMGVVCRPILLRGRQSHTACAAQRAAGVSVGRAVRVNAGTWMQTSRG